MSKRDIAHRPRNRFYAFHRASTLKVKPDKSCHGWMKGGRRDVRIDGEREGEMDRWMDESIDGGRERVRRG